MEPAQRFRITAHPCASQDIQRLKNLDPGLYDGMRQALARLAKQGDLLSPEAPLDICYCYPVAPSCLRFKVRGEKWRVVLEVLQNGKSIRPEPGMSPSDVSLRIIFVRERSDKTYYVELAARMEEL